jgi:integrase/recombinase XerD
MELIDLRCRTEGRKSCDAPRGNASALAHGGRIAGALTQRSTSGAPTPAVDPLSRLIIELLVRTGIRRSELLALTVDAVVQIGSAYWLEVPIGKLHNDRFIRLHPQLKDLLDDWITHHRPHGLPTNRLLLEHNRPISHHRVALHRVADTAGISKVTAHQLRHTLATQAVNRGMSLDAITALLGPKALAMTMTYARIADKSVADEYFADTEKVEALRPAQPARRRRRTPRDARAAHRDAPMHARQRVLRTTGRDGLPLRVDLRIPQLLRHHHRVPAHPARTTDHAARKHQIGRQNIFDRILNRLNTTAS